MEKLNLKTLLRDESFLNYCKRSNQEDVLAWENWLRENPQYREEVEEQKRIVQSVGFHAAEFTVEENYLRLRDRIEKRKTNDKIPSRFRFPTWLKVAASITLVSSVLYFTSRFREGAPVNDVAIESPLTIPQNNAVLTLADGSTIALDQVEKGTVALQGGIRLEKTASGDIVYHIDSESATSPNAYNSIATAKGNQYAITLPDGSKAWLNASSSLRYPVKFAADQRRVQMTGEVYFEISKVDSDSPGKEKAIPFFVQTDKQEIRVLGTHFNVNAYEDEPYVITTLVEGSVRVTATADGQSVLLTPGQQSVLNKNILVRSANLEQQIAWTKGDFIFHAERLDAILRKVSRWYDVEIECPDHLGRLTFDGIVSRSQPLSTIIDMIQSTGKAKIKLEGRRITVTE